MRTQFKLSTTLIEYFLTKISSNSILCAHLLHILTEIIINWVAANTYLYTNTYRMMQNMETAFYK